MNPSSRKGILIVTQVMDEQDSNLGFFVTWVRRLAVECGRPVHVLCWKKGTLTDVPANVQVTALPSGALRRTFALWWWSWKHRDEMGSVFVHMIPDVIVAVGPLWKMLGWKIILWYTHGSVSLSLKVAAWWTDKILTASPGSCRLASSKVNVVGHGIDVDFFKPDGSVRQPLLLTVGRITPRKDLMALIRLCTEIREADPSLVFRALIVGEPRTDGDRAYLAKVRQEIVNTKLDQVVSVVGAKIGQELVHLYATAAAVVSPSLTGSLDKVVLEALACETPVLAVGEAYGGMVGVHRAVKAWDEASVAYAVARLRYPKAFPEARASVQHNADLNALIKKICSALSYA